MSTLPVVDDLTTVREHWDETIPCAAPDCDQAATARASMRCCGWCAFACPRHLVRLVAKVQHDLLAPRGAVCRSCAARFPSGSAVYDVLRVVTL